MIDDLRQEIDQVDEALVSLINKRLDIARRIGILKREADRPVLDDAREIEIIKRIGLLNKGPATRKGIERIFMAILDASRELQHRNRPAEDEE